VENFPGRSGAAEMITHPQDDSARSVAIRYVKSQLGCGKTFSSLLLETIDFETGYFSSLVPAGYSPTQIIELDQGHLMEGGRAQPIRVGNLSGVALKTLNADKELANCVRQMLESPKSYCLLENCLTIPQDAWLQRTKSRIAIYDLDVYHLVMHDDKNKASVEEAIREARHLPTFVGTVGEAPEIDQICASKQIVITLDQLRVFAKSVKLLFVSAYDGEGYLCWWPGAPSLSDE
jgi:hypothetical protein